MAPVAPVSPPTAPVAAPVAAPTGDDDFIYVGCFKIGENEVFNFDEIEGTDDMTPTVSSESFRESWIYFTLETGVERYRAGLPPDV